MTQQDNHVDEARKDEVRDEQGEEEKPLVDRLLDMKGKTLQEKLERLTWEQCQTQMAKSVTERLAEDFREADLEVGDLTFLADGGYFTALIRWNMEKSKFRLAVNVEVGRKSSFEDYEGEVGFPLERFELVVRDVLRGYGGLRIRAAIDPEECAGRGWNVYLQGVLEINKIPVLVEYSLWIDEKRPD